jgi:lysylphosphatidylglycerol synthetase-like protein (DUF2156 family)
MKLIKILSIIFCVYATISKGISWMTLSKTIGKTNSQNEFELMADAKFQSSMSLVWFCVFALLIIIWVISLLRKWEKLKLTLVSVTIISALLMSITDNIETEVYISDVVVGGEMI